jgi:hypothetical protein
MPNESYKQLKNFMLDSCVVIESTLCPLFDRTFEHIAVRRHLDLLAQLIMLKGHGFDPPFSTAVRCLHRHLASHCQPSDGDSNSARSKTSFLGAGKLAGEWHGTDTAAIKRANVLFLYWLSLRCLAVACDHSVPQPLHPWLDQMLRTLMEHTEMFSASAAEVFADHDGRMLLVCQSQLEIWTFLRNETLNGSSSSWISDSLRRQLLDDIHPSRTFGALLCEQYEASECADLIMDGSQPFIASLSVLFQAVLWTLPDGVSLEFGTEELCTVNLNADLRSMLLTLGRILHQLLPSTPPKPISDLLLLLDKLQSN